MFFATEKPSANKNMYNINHNNLPQAVETILKRMDDLEALIAGRHMPIESDDLINVNEAAALLKMTPGAIYHKTHAKQIPFHKLPGSHRILFSRSELTEWVKSQSRKELTK